MSEHGWPDFHDDGLHHHDDGGDHHADQPDHQEELVPHELVPHDDGYFDDVHHDVDVPEAHDVHEATPVWEEHQEIHDAVEHSDEPQDELHTVGADPDALPEPDAAEAVTSFPPLLDVGPLPEPVDGFPWIDTGSLGLIDPSVLHAAAQAQIHPQDLADYAGQELPPGQDPWAALADSDDPATSALARWWSEQQQ